jgi:YD repeat-containing protein
MNPFTDTPEQVQAQQAAALRAARIVGSQTSSHPTSSLVVQKAKTTLTPLYDETGKLRGIAPTAKINPVDLAQCSFDSAGNLKSCKDKNGTLIDVVSLSSLKVSKSGRRLTTATPMLPVRKSAVPNRHPAYNASGQVIGLWNPDHPTAVRKAAGDTTPTLGTAVFDSVGNLLGTVGPGGIDVLKPGERYAYDAHGAVTGTIHADGTVTDVTPTTPPTEAGRDAQATMQATAPSAPGDPEAVPPAVAKAMKSAFGFGDDVRVTHGPVRKSLEVARARLTDDNTGELRINGNDFRLLDVGRR